MKDILNLRKIAFDSEPDPNPIASRRESHARDFKKLGFQVSKLRLWCRLPTRSVASQFTAALMVSWNRNISLPHTTLLMELLYGISLFMVKDN